MDEAIDAEIKRRAAAGAELAAAMRDRLSEDWMEDFENFGFAFPPDGRTVLVSDDVAWWLEDGMLYGAHDAGGHARFLRVDEDGRIERGLRGLGDPEAN